MKWACYRASDVGLFVNIWVNNLQNAMIPKNQERAPHGMSPTGQNEYQPIMYPLWCSVCTKVVPKSAAFCTKTAPFFVVLGKTTPSWKNLNLALSLWYNYIDRLCLCRVWQFGAGEVIRIMCNTLDEKYRFPVPLIGASGAISLKILHGQFSDPIGFYSANPPQKPTP